MSAARVALLRAPLAFADRDRIAAAIDMPAMVGLGFDPATEVFTPDPAHRLLGYEVCAVAGCGSEAWCKDRLCGGCATRRAKDPERPLAEFLAVGIPGRRPGERLCVVCRLPGASRPASANRLCLSCDRMRLTRHQSVAAYVDGDGTFEPASPRPTLGTCAVVSCGRLVARKVHGLCEAHDQAWRKAGCPALETFSCDALPCRGDRQGRVVLTGLPAQVICEVLLGIQSSLAAGRRIMPTDLRAAVDHLRRQRVTSVAHVDGTKLTAAVRRFLELCADEAALASADVESEREKDVWDLRHWGKRGRLSFAGGSALHQNGRTSAPPITQRWLKESAKIWAADALSSRGKMTVQTTLNALGTLSEHLARREDVGAVPAALRRKDVEAFLARLGHLEATGAMTPYVRRRVVDAVANFLRECRSLGLTGPGGLMADLLDEVALRRGDRPPPVRRDPEDLGRALPEVVMSQLLSEESLAQLEEMAGPIARAAVELAAGVGRRTSELCALSFTCLDYDSHVSDNGEQRASPVLVHDMPKVGAFSCRLPINDREARIISAQQARVRAAFPQTPPEHLVLFPRTLKNPDGTRPVSASWLAWVMRRWVDALDRLDGPERDATGLPVPYPRQRVFPYAFRHSFAQRHADAGTPVDTLKELLGHGTVRVTLTYYRVTARRKRAAQDALGPLQLDARGGRVRPGISELESSEALRDQVGQVAVPFGVCTEPTNVGAEGHSCPFRHRCVGCEYFRTDPSFQPELEGYLAQLLGDRERLAAAAPALAEWARADAVPSPEEIEAVRRLVRANTEVLAGCNAEERERIDAAIATVRKERAALATTFPVEFRGLARQPRPTLFPTIERAARLKEATGG